MTQRNFSMEKYWNTLAENHRPRMAFNGESRQDWEDWEAQARAKLLELLGPFPERVPLNAEVELSLIHI